MPKSATSHPETKQRRVEALERIQRLQALVSARNRDLTAEQAEAIAEEFGQAAIERLRERGVVSVERDKS
jgi:hypothetical protein